jgi:hypothetical protein
LFDILSEHLDQESCQAFSKDPGYVHINQLKWWSHFANNGVIVRPEDLPQIESEGQNLKHSPARSAEPRESVPNDKINH